MSEPPPWDTSAQQVHPDQADDLIKPVTIDVLLARSGLRFRGAA